MDHRIGGVLSEFTKDYLATLKQKRERLKLDSDDNLEPEIDPAIKFKINNLIERARNINYYDLKFPPNITKTLKLKSFKCCNNGHRLNEIEVLMLYSLNLNQNDGYETGAICDGCNTSICWTDNSYHCNICNFDHCLLCYNKKEKLLTMTAADIPIGSPGCDLIHSLVNNLSPEHKHDIIPAFFDEENSNMFDSSFIGYGNTPNRTPFDNDDTNIGDESQLNIRTEHISFSDNPDPFNINDFIINNNDSTFIHNTPSTINLSVFKNQSNSSFSEDPLPSNNELNSSFTQAPNSNIYPDHNTLNYNTLDPDNNPCVQELNILINSNFTKNRNKNNKKEEQESNDTDDEYPEYKRSENDDYDGNNTPTSPISTDVDDTLFHEQPYDMDPDTNPCVQLIVN